jgi:hypothetical protein
VGDGDADGVSISDGVGVGDSCANAITTESASKGVSADAFVMSSGVETSLNISEPSYDQTISRDSSTSLGMTSHSRIITPVEVREKIVAPLAIGEEFFIDCAGRELVVQLIEAAKVIEGALGGVFARGASPHQERPIA